MTTHASTPRGLHYSFFSTKLNIKSFYTFLLAFYIPHRGDIHPCEKEECWLWSMKRERRTDDERLCRIRSVRGAAHPLDLSPVLRDGAAQRQDDRHRHLLLGGRQPAGASRTHEAAGELPQGLRAGSVFGRRLHRCRLHLDQPCARRPHEYRRRPLEQVLRAGAGARGCGRGTRPCGGHPVWGHHAAVPGQHLLPGRLHAHGLPGRARQPRLPRGRLHASEQPRDPVCGKR